MGPVKAWVEVPQGAGVLGASARRRNETRADARRPFCCALEVLAGTQRGPQGRPLRGTVTEWVSTTPSDAPARE
jgi:hypothetical protein